MGFFAKISDQYKELWKAIIRPPRDRYRVEDIGPTVFPLGRRTYKRTDLTLRNPRGQNLVCSHFEPIESERRGSKLPVVIYMHGNCSSRIEALVSLNVLLPQNITVFCLDFSGCGHSEGEFVSLGWFERDDLATAIQYLRSTNRTSYIGLWGRSMGAVTALMHGDRDPSIAAMVVDSPFSSLRRLAEELADVYVAWKMPRFFVSTAMSMLRSSILSRAGFDIDKLNPIEHAAKSYIPALFVSADNDRFILPHHAKDIAKVYGGDLNIIKVVGDHNSVRPQFLHDSIAIFFHNTLQCASIGSDRVEVENLWPKTFTVMKERNAERAKRKAKKKEMGNDDPSPFSNGCTTPDRSAVKNMMPPAMESCFTIDENGSVRLVDNSRSETQEELVQQHLCIANLIMANSEKGNMGESISSSSSTAGTSTTLCADDMHKSRKNSR